MIPRCRNLHFFLKKKKQKSGQGLEAVTFSLHHSSFPPSSRKVKTQTSLVTQRNKDTGKPINVDAFKPGGFMLFCNTNISWYTMHGKRAESTRDRNAKSSSSAHSTPIYTLPLVAKQYPSRLCPYPDRFPLVKACSFDILSCRFVLYSWSSSFATEVEQLTKDAWQGWVKLVTSNLWSLDGLRILKLCAPDIVPKFGCHTESSKIISKPLVNAKLGKCIPKFKVLVMVGQVVFLQFPHITR